MTQFVASAVSCPRMVKRQAVLSQMALAGLCWSKDSKSSWNTPSCCSPSDTLTRFILFSFSVSSTQLLWHSFLDLQSAVPEWWRDRLSFHRRHLVVLCWSKDSESSWNTPSCCSHRTLSPFFIYFHFHFIPPNFYDTVCCIRSHLSQNGEETGCPFTDGTCWTLLVERQ